MNPPLAAETSTAAQLLAATPWIYRSFHNLPTLIGGDPEKALALIFGEGIFSFIVIGTTISGTFDMSSNYVLDIAGEIQNGAANAATSLNFIGKGRTGTPTEGWQYDYQAFLSPTWPEATNQIPAFTGTVVRALPHNGEPAGVTASFILNAVIPVELAALSPVSFSRDILPKFRAKDINCMRTQGVLLSDPTWMCDPTGDGAGYADHAHARMVFAALSGGQMPPDEAWPQNWIAAYTNWMNTGFQP